MSVPEKHGLTAHVDCDCRTWQLAIHGPREDCLSLWKRSQAGDRLAAEAIVLRFKGLIWSRIRQRLPYTSEDVRWDLFQEVYLRIFHDKMPRYFREGPDRTFCYWVRLLANQGIVEIRRRKTFHDRCMPLPENLEAAHGSLEEVPEVTPAERDRLDRALAELTETQQRVWQYHCDGRNAEEIGRLCGIPGRTIRSWIVLIRQQLARCLDPPR